MRNRLTTTLLWIAIALLPLRGWAAAQMAVAWPGGADASVSAAADEAHGVTPCHAGAHSMAWSADVGDAAEHTSVNGSHTCSMCDLCHTGAAQSEPPTLWLPALPHAAPHGAAPPAIEPRAPDGLFRPPRTNLA